MILVGWVSSDKVSIFTTPQSSSEVNRGSKVKQFKSVESETIMRRLFMTNKTRQSCFHDNPGNCEQTKVRMEFFFPKTSNQGTSEDTIELSSKLKLPTFHVFIPCAQCSTNNGQQYTNQNLHLDCSAISIQGCQDQN